MTAPAGSHIALRHARLLLVKAGLSEEEADRFLRRISEEVVSGKLESQETRLEFIENQLAQIKSPGVATTAITAVATGLFTNALYDIIKAGVQGVKPEAPPAPPDEVDIIQIEWAEIRLPKKSYELEGALRSALKTREQKHGTFDKRVAVYLDAIAMCLDAKRNHRGAVQLRRQALKISQRVTGATSESTAAALCNLGLSLFALGEYRETDLLIGRGMRMMRNSMGDAHAYTLGAIYDCYFVINAQRRFPATAQLAQFRQSLSQIREIAQYMMARKLIMVSVLGLKDILESLPVG